MSEALRTLEDQLASGLADALIRIARDAGDAILEIYEASEGIEIDRKADDSPLTQADLASNAVIVEALRALTPDLPILSEESAEIGYEDRRSWEAFYLVDPLDGTKEFIKRNGEFTVNIALIEHGAPMAGVVHAPDLETTYYGQLGDAPMAHLIDPTGTEIGLEALTPEPDEPIGVVVSRSHLNDETQAFVDQLSKHGREVDLVPSGSSLKFCRIAEGSAHLYPRLAPTMEWDTGAAQAVLEAAGGLVLQADSLEPLRYNKQDLLNPHFIATASRDLLPG